MTGHSKSHLVLRAWLTVMLALGLIVTARGASAAQGAAPTGFPIYGLICDELPEVTSPFQAQFPPEGCEGRAGIEMRVESPDGSDLGSCVTGADGRCGVAGIDEVLIIVRQVPSTVPAGYASGTNLVLTWNYSEFRGAEFFNVPTEVVATPPPAGNATLTVHSRVCPAGFSGTDYDAACHDTAPAYDQTLFLSGPRDGTTVIDEDGNATFPDLPAGDYFVTPGFPVATERVVAFCSREGEPGVEYPSAVDSYSEYSPPNLYTIEVSLEPDSGILCDVFAVPSVDPSGVS